MCGIAGLIASPGRGIEPGWLQAMETAMRHRGPDGFGFLGWRRGDGTALRSTQIAEDCAGTAVGLVHRRLAIIDVSQAGAQPMVSPCGRHAIIFNGEAYNFIELRQRLERLGHHFHGHSDTEVVLAALLQWGAREALPMLTGMFALAWLDLQRERLVVARDPFGIKPLYLARWNGHFAFASEIPTLLALPGFPRRAEPATVMDYLCRGWTDRGRPTFFADISRLPAGHWQEIDLNGVALGDSSPYVVIAPADRCDLSFDEAADRLRQMFLDSVRLHLRSDVPVGVTLSGGIDSSALVVAMRALGGDGVQLHGFGYRADSPALDEGRWMTLAAEAAGASLHTVTPNAAELDSHLGPLIAQQAEPFPTTSIYAQARVYGLAQAAGIKVTLDGQGADEMLAGYPTYLSARLAESAHQGRLGEAMALLRAGGLKAGAAALTMLAPAALSAAALQLAGRGAVPRWLNQGWAPIWQGAQAPLPRRRGLLHDRLEQTLFDLSLPALLRFCDRNSMAQSVESRLPFLTVDLARFILSLPARYLIDDQGTTKAVFRQAMRGLVPEAILDRRDKIGFATPERQWLAKLPPQMMAAVTDLAAGDLPMLRRDSVRSACAKLQSGTLPTAVPVWRWLNLLLWSRLMGVAL